MQADCRKAARSARQGANQEWFAYGLVGELSTLLMMTMHQDFFGGAKAAPIDKQEVIRRLKNGVARAFQR